MNTKNIERHADAIVDATRDYIERSVTPLVWRCDSLGEENRMLRQLLAKLTVRVTSLETARQIADDCKRFGLHE